MPAPASWKQMTVEQRLDWVVMRMDYIAQSSANVGEANQIFANAFRQIGELKQEMADFKATAAR